MAPFFEIFKHVSISERGIAGPASSIRWWSSCSIATASWVFVFWGSCFVIALIGTRQPQTADDRWHEGWVQPTFLTAFTVGCTHPTPAPSSPCELRSTASCWPCSRFSARGPGWPACPQRAGNANGLKLAARESAIGRDSKPAPGPSTAPSRKSGPRNTGKIVKKGPENRRRIGAFSRAKAPVSPCSQPKSPRSQAARKQDLTSISHRGLEPPRTRRMRKGAPFFGNLGTSRMCTQFEILRLNGFYRASVRSPHGSNRL